MAPKKGKGDKRLKGRRLAAILLCFAAVAAVLVAVFWNPLFRFVVHPVYSAAKLAAFAREDKDAPAGGVVFLGDSVTDSCDLARYFPGIQALNRGVMGDATGHMLARMEEVYALEPSVIVLQVGMNDFLNEKRSVDYAAQNYEIILSVIQARLPGTAVICQPVLPGYDTLLCKPEKWQGHIVEFNEEIRFLAQRHGYIYVDTYTPFLEESSGLGSRVYLKDGVHPSEEGYTLLAGILTPHIEACLQAL